MFFIGGTLNLQHFAIAVHLGLRTVKTAALGYFCSLVNVFVNSPVAVASSLSSLSSSVFLARDIHLALMP